MHEKQRKGPPAFPSIPTSGEESAAAPASTIGIALSLASTPSTL